LMSIDLG